ncbi:MAG: FAD-dependent oxidoreductase [Pseudomonadota bacterium]
MEKMKTDSRIVVAGAGVAGLTAALHLAEKGFQITLVDKSDAAGGILPRLDIQFPNDHCGMCRLLPMIGREGSQDFCLKRGVFHDNIEFLPGTQVAGVSGNPGNLEVSLAPAPGRDLEQGQSGALSPEASGDVRVQPEPLTHVAAVILTGGGAIFNPADQVLYNMAELPNVVTALDFEQRVAGSALSRDAILRPSDNAEAKRIAWIQCVGSRTLGKGKGSPLCASACCMFSVKEAIHAKAITRGAADAAIFYMDMRTFGREYQKYRDHAQKDLGVRFIRCRVHSIEAGEEPGDLVINYVDSDGLRRSEIFDMAVLATGKSAPPEETQALADLAAVKGVHLLQSATRFKDISDTVKGAQAVVSEVESLVRDLAPSLKSHEGAAAPDSGNMASLTSKPKSLLVFVKSGDLLAGDDWTAIMDQAKIRFTLDMETVENLDPETLESMAALITNKKINRVLIAALRPSTTLPGKGKLEKLLGLPWPFIGIADLTPYFARQESDPDAWCHALAMIEASMRLLKRARIYPEHGRRTVKKALIIGGGPAGLMAAKSVADAGFNAVIVDRAEAVGGNARYITGSGIQSRLEALVREVSANPRIEILTGRTLKQHTGHAGNFRVLAASDSQEPVIVHHGAVILATGGGLNATRSYHWGEDERITTIAAFRDRVDTSDPALGTVNTVAMILCADSRKEPFNYCSRICCLKTLETAIVLKEKRPEIKIFIFYRDIMTYGSSEAVYTRAREMGIFFVQYQPDAKPRVSIGPDGLILEAFDPFSGFEMTLHPDMLCLAPGLIPGSGKPMAELLGVNLTPEGFIQEADYKWRPVDTGREGIFVCGLARAPGRIDEILEDGQAAAARAVRILDRDLLVPSPVTARVRDTACSRCGICIGVCPYGARYFSLTENKVKVDAAACQGCGSCAVACPNSATVISCFEDTALMEALEEMIS